MDVEVVILQRLLDDATVAGIVAGRGYQLKLPQKPTLPALKVQLVDDPQDYHLRGGSVLTRARIQTDAIAQEGPGVDPYADASALARAIDAALSGQVFTDTGSPPSRKVTGCFRISRVPFYDPDAIREVRIMQDYTVWSRTL